MPETTSQVNLDTNSVNEAGNVLSSMGLTITDAVKITIDRIAREKYFDRPIIPNDLTAKTINNARNGIDMKSAEDINDLLKQLKEGDCA